MDWIPQKLIPPPKTNSEFTHWETLRLLFGKVYFQGRRVSLREGYLPAFEGGKYLDQTYPHCGPNGGQASCKLITSNVFSFWFGELFATASRILRRLKLHYEQHFSFAKAPLGFAWPWFLEKVNQCGAFNGDESHGISISKKIT